MRPRDFPAVFAALRAILEESAAGLEIRTDQPGRFELWTPLSRRFAKPMFFGGVRQGKTYVSFHLMPIYVFPDLLRGVPRTLRARMQGKSCFSFTGLPEAQRTALAELTRRARERYRTEEVG